MHPSHSGTHYCYDTTILLAWLSRYLRHLHMQFIVLTLVCQVTSAFLPTSVTVKLYLAEEGESDARRLPQNVPRPLHHSALVITR
ncbi:hypothetical protein KM540_gp019 [Western grey kangaroopox virus]|uniref:Uncharacterized protein n=1 Tax=Western grey kangaroopox virus TaxID=1566307 RepID=A0A2C9DSG7_9POXV|nr:hypothetical protein KM540_gp019 [Western grey kangaroopox virus]ATI20950.1 hypothetical protein [Western grey kangaroopox virus]